MLKNYIKYSKKDLKKYKRVKNNKIIKTSSCIEKNIKFFELTLTFSGDKNITSQNSSQGSSVISSLQFNNHFTTL